MSPTRFLRTCTYALPLAAFTVLTATAADLPARPSAGDLVKQSKPADWRPLDPNNTLYMELSLIHI